MPWNLQNSTVFDDLFAIDASDANTALACGDNLAIVRTINGGTNWNLVFSGTGIMRGISHVGGNVWIAVSRADTDVGGGAGGGVIRRSVDNGVTWLQVASFSGTGSSNGAPDGFNHVHFFDANNGVAVGDTGTFVPAAPPAFAFTFYTPRVFTTTNGGLTWTDRGNPIGFGTTLSSAWHHSATEIIVTVNQGNPGRVMRSTDGGASFTTILAPASLTGIQNPTLRVVRSGNSIFVGSDVSVLFRSEDNAATWDVINLGEGNYDVLGLHFNSATRGWAAITDPAAGNGENRIFFTANGGDTWTEQLENNSTHVLRDIVFVDNSTGFAAGFSNSAEAVIFATTDAGGLVVPTANAGPDQSVDVNTIVVLNGVGSSSPDGSALTYSWVQTAGPAVVLSGPLTATPDFTAPAAPASLTFELTVTNTSGESDTDTVVISVSVAPLPPPGPPPPLGDDEEQYQRAAIRLGFQEIHARLPMGHMGRRLRVEFHLPVGIKLNRMFAHYVPRKRRVRGA